MSPRLASVVFTAAVIAMIASAIIGYTVGQKSTNSANSGTAQAAENANVIDLPPGEKLVNADEQPLGVACYLTRPMRPGETPETYRLCREKDRTVYDEITIREHAAAEKK